MSTAEIGKADPHPAFAGIALWLGHESPTTTHQYTQANLAIKEKALARMQDPDTAAKRFKATDSLLEFLKTL